MEVSSVCGPDFGSLLWPSFASGAPEEIRNNQKVKDAYLGEEKK